MNLRNLFLQRIAQTSSSPLGLGFSKAEGVFLYDLKGKQYIDLISGISVSNVGHSHPRIVQAVQQQAAQYMHLMVYGEFVQAPQVLLADKLVGLLADQLNTVYYTNSGAEAVEGALKLAKRYTQRSEIVYCKHSYHGSTMGALSVLGDEYFKANYRPLIPDCRMIQYNSIPDLENISENTASVLIEPVQAEAGVVVPSLEYMEALRTRCTEKGALLIFDEIQTGMGRTGSMFRHQSINTIPDILLLAKAFGGGMPLGAFISDAAIFSVFQDNPVLGHITTFGGHPVSCAAALEALTILNEEPILSQVEYKGQLFENTLTHPKIIRLNRCGLLMAIHFENETIVKNIIDRCIKKGLIVDWFLFAPHCIRIAPPLIIEEKEIKEACTLLLESIDEATN